MALTTKRIIALPSQTDPQSGDYLAIDNGTNGTHKIPVGRIGVELDDTLTESGKAADAKATGDAIDALRTQLEVTGTASGAIATFSDGADAPTKSCIATIVPKQAGSGTPSPENERPISGWESVSVMVSPTEDEADATTTTTSLGRTVYGGTLDVVSGVLTVDRAIVDLGTLDWSERVSGTGQWVANLPTTSITPVSGGDREALCERYELLTAESQLPANGQFFVNNTALSSTKKCCICDTSYSTASDFKSAMSGVKLIYSLEQPQTYTLTPTEVNTLLGENNVWADSGDVSVVYVRDLNIAINNLIGE